MSRLQYLQGGPTDLAVLEYLCTGRLYIPDCGLLGFPGRGPRPNHDIISLPLLSHNATRCQHRVQVGEMTDLFACPFARFPPCLIGLSVGNDRVSRTKPPLAINHLSPAIRYWAFRPRDTMMNLVLTWLSLYYQATTYSLSTLGLAKLAPLLPHLPTTHRIGAHFDLATGRQWLWSAFPLS